MIIKPKTRRLLFFLFITGIFMGGIALILRTFRENLVFFYTPSEMQTQTIDPGKKIRLGGLVKNASLRQTDTGISFELTDHTHSVPVVYTGLLPDLFREGQGVVAEGAWSLQGVFQAASIFAKHDEFYMPKEIVDSLKRQGTWKGKF